MIRGHRSDVIVGGIAILLSAGLLAAAPAQRQTFTAGVDLIRIDVSVLDKNRRPVRGLKAEDFLVREDGRPRAIETLAEIDVPDAATSQQSFGRRVPSDITTNGFNDQRLFVIVMDDATIEQDVFALKSVKTIGHSVIDKLGATDLAAVIFTRDNTNTQGFTADHAKLHSAVDTFTLGFRGTSSDPTSDALYFTNSIQTLEEAIHYLIAAPDRRKVLLYIGQGIPIDHRCEQAILIAPGMAVNPGGCGGVVGRRDPGSSNPSTVQIREMNIGLIGKMKEIFQQAKLANVNVYPIDPCGLRAPSVEHPTCQPGLEVEYLQTVAGNTDGRALINTNNFEPGISQIFVENSSYYLVGYRRVVPKSPGTYSRIEVKVSHPGVATVRSRRLAYADPSDEERAIDTHRALPAPAEKAIAGILPNSDTPLRVTAAAIAVPNALLRGVFDAVPAAVAITVGIQEPVPPNATTEDIDVLTMAFTPEGSPRKTERQTATVTVKPHAADAQTVEPSILPTPSAGSNINYEIRTRLDLAPGRYSLRLAVHNQRTNQNGSVYFDVDVPDFLNAPLSLSGMFITASSAPTSATAGSLAVWWPIVPTTVRTFSARDRVQAFLRVYQANWTAKADPIPTLIQISDSSGKTVFERTGILEAGAFGSEGSSDVTFTLPLAELRPDTYALTFSASKGTTKIDRAVVFSVR